MQKAVVNIKRRSEPVLLEVERAKKLKALMLDPKTDPDTRVDLEEWIGDIRDIKSISFPKFEKVCKVDTDTDEMKEQRYINALLAMTPRERAGQQYGIFRIDYFVRSKFRSEPTEDDMVEMLDLAEKYFIEHPKQYKTPSEVFDPILTKHFGAKSEKVGQVLRSNS